MKTWSPKAIDWYMRAGECSDYPRLILDRILPQVRPTDAVLDIGCGPGVYALALAPYVQLVLALDRERQAVDSLAAQAASRGISNITCLHQTWPNYRLPSPKIDVAISALASGEIMTGQRSIMALVGLKPRLTFLVAPGQYLPPFGWEQHRQRSACHGGDTQNFLGQLGIRYTAEDINLDFGQPVKDMAEAVEFLAAFLKIPAADARQQARAIAKPHRLGLYLPSRRNLQLITLVSSPAQ